MLLHVSCCWRPVEKFRLLALAAAERADGTPPTKRRRPARAVDASAMALTAVERRDKEFFSTTFLANMEWSDRVLSFDTLRGRRADTVKGAHARIIPGRSGASFV